MQHLSESSSAYSEIFNEMSKGFILQPGCRLSGTEESLKIFCVIPMLHIFPKA
jgi:hypothetical protein